MLRDCLYCVFANVEMIKRALRKHLEDFSFEINEPYQILRIKNVGSKQIHKKDDLLFFHIDLVAETNVSTILDVFYLKKFVLRFNVMETNSIRKELVFGDRRFLLFDTHQVEMQGNVIKTIFISLENNKICFDDTDLDPQIEPHLPFICTGVPDVSYEGLDWLPLHPEDPLLDGAKLLGVPQRSPTWFATKAPGTMDLTGSSVGKYACGYWLDRDNDVGTIKDQLRKESNMRFGRIYEDCVMMITMYNFPTWEYSECGRGSFTQSEIDRLGLHQREGLTYGCSRDARAIIPTATHILPYPDIEDVRACELEFKASYSSTAFPDYYIPQLYWEMIEGHSGQAMLVRYKRRRAQVNGRWITKHEANAYTIQRDAEIERMIIRNVNTSLRRDARIPLNEYISNVNPHPYDELKQALAQLAKNTPAMPLEIPVDLLDDYVKRRRDLITTLKRK